MKVNVIQAKELTFTRWQLWSDWIDVCVFECGYDVFLLQMKVSRRNKKKFRTVDIANRSCTASEVGDLTQMTREAA